jgi:hypothetical protein
MIGTSPTSIASSEQFKKALLVVRDRNLPSGHFAMLRAQCRAPNATITATQLAAAADYENYNAANLQYGTLAMRVATALGYNPEEKHADGSPCWWTTLSYSNENQAEENTGHFQFIMRPALVTALREMRWA